MKKSLWKKRIQKYNHYEFSTRHYVEEKYKKKGTCVIQLDLPDFNSFIEPYSIQQPILKKELGEYIERVCYDIPTYYPISIQLYDYYTEEEKEKIKSFFFLHLQLHPKISATLPRKVLLISLHPSFLICKKRLS